MAYSIFTPVLKVIQAVHDLTKEHKGIGYEFRVGIRSLGNDMETIEKEIEKYEEQELQELAYEIEDFLLGLTTPGAFGFVLTALGRNPGDGQLATIRYFRAEIDKLQKLREISQRGEEGAAGVATPVVAASSSDSPARINQLVGNAKFELEELLSAVDAARLGVISVVGCRGLGKTALARAVYNEASVVPGGFHCKAWAVASEYKDNLQGLLSKILQQIPTESEASGSTSPIRQVTRETVYAALANRRYFVVIDDMLDIQLWDNAKSAFPDTAGSIIVVTTSIQRIATYVGRHRYNMPYLDIDSSRRLLHQTMGNVREHPISNEDMSLILRKCDGIPLALVSVATHLKWNPTDRHCSNDVAKSLGTHITVKGGAFEDLKRTLVECYNSLPGYQDRRCLLSLSMFQQGHQINMKSLLRKWTAEGLVANQGQRDAMDVAYNSSKEFLERSIIDPVLIGNNSDVKRCQVNGTMLEFIVYNSTCATNFATLIHPYPHGRLPRIKGHKAIRRLFVCDGGMEEAENVCVIRWLTLCPKAHFDLSKCSLVRVLDLESCELISTNVLENICKLVLVKYLSLRGTDVSEIPKEIKRLVNLETLDIRGTKVKVLPVKVAMMPGLLHLFGQFELEPRWRQSCLNKAVCTVKDKVRKKAKPPSKLETLAGAIIDKDEKCFKQVMLHSKKLKKVKIFCNKTAATDLIPVEKFCGKEVLESLSVDCSEQPIRLLSGEFLGSSCVPCSIKSLKLRGNLEGLPATPENIMKLHEATWQKNFMKLQKVEELQLSSTGHRWKELSVLQKMYGLVYLKLTEDHHAFEDDSFIVQKDGFQELRRLCIQAPRLPRVKFEEGAMPCLTSLQLLQTSEETPDVTSPQPEDLVQTGATLEAPLPVGVISDITSHPSESGPCSLDRNNGWPVFLFKFTWTKIYDLVYTAMALFKVLITAKEAPSLQPVALVLTEETPESEPDLGVEGLSHLMQLNEVILHHSAPGPIVRGWKAEAKKHINRPHVKKQPFVGK